jgi:hypothetical protein
VTSSARWSTDRRPFELQPGQPRRDRVESCPVLVEGGQTLVGLRKHRGYVLEDVFHPAEIERDDVAALGDRDHEGIGLLGDALGGPMAGTRLRREDRGVGHQLDVGADDLGRLLVEDDRPVHLRHLVEQRRGVVDVEVDAPRKEKGDLLRVSDDDQPARARMDDVVDALAERGARGDDVESPQEPWVLSRLQLLQIITGKRRRHRR